MLTHAFQCDDDDVIAFNHQTQANGTNYGMGNVDFQSPFFFEMFDMDKDPWQLYVA